MFVINDIDKEESVVKCGNEFDKIEDSSDEEIFFVIGDIENFE